MNDTLTMRRADIDRQLQRSSENVLIIALSFLPGIVCYQLCANHAPLYATAAFAGFFAYMGITTIARVYRRKRTNSGASA